MQHTQNNPAESGTSPHSTSHHWFRRLLMVNFLVALVLGTWGYREYHHETRWVDALYNSAQ